MSHYNFFSQKCCDLPRSFNFRSVSKIRLDWFIVSSFYTSIFSHFVPARPVTTHHRRVWVLAHKFPSATTGVLIANLKSVLHIYENAEIDFSFLTKALLTEYADLFSTNTNCDANSVYIHNFKCAHLHIADNVSKKPETLTLLAVNKSIGNSIVFLLSLFSEGVKMRVFSFRINLSKQLSDKII